MRPAGRGPYSQCSFADIWMDNEAGRVEKRGEYMECVIFILLEITIIYFFFFRWINAER